MRRQIHIIALAFSASLVLVACSSDSTSISQSETLDPMAFCVATSSLWDSSAIPNVDEEMSGAERATTVATLKTAIGILPQGVALNAFTEEQSNLLARSYSLIVKLYEDSSISELGPSATPKQIADALGISEDEYTELDTEMDKFGPAALDSLLAYCQS